METISIKNKGKVNWLIINSVLKEIEIAPITDEDIPSKTHFPKAS